MHGNQLIGRACAPVVEIVRAIGPDKLDAQTPCAEYDVRGLVNHLLFFGPSLEGAGRKAPTPPPAENESDVDLTKADDWAGDLVAQLERTAAAWSAPEAWEGTTSMVGPTPMPAPMIGGMVVGELVLHGWDLAQATDQRPVWDDDVLAFVHGELENTAQMGRKMGAYGPEVPVPADAPLLHRILGLAGRAAS
ncbi:MAG: TIGR03086 family protein [Streptosporangiales bacterium]|nr:TIGR03086 family protein [Streptosporangiales bacterium]